MANPPSALNRDFDRAKRAKFRRALLGWFDAHRRDLPWRADPEPYRVWVSEIMLQQTRVSAVLEHYRYFLERFPDVMTLARARLSTVLAAWSGLGYYRRARMMHVAARQIVRESHGRFPQNSESWRALPGVGRYTAAAIASICCGERCAVVDGNVKRVLERAVFVSGVPHRESDLSLRCKAPGRRVRAGVLCASTSVAGERPHGTAELWNVAQELLSRQRPGDFNQAMMELGATVCQPRTPRCMVCPVRACCRTAANLAGGREGPPAHLDTSPVKMRGGGTRRQRVASEIHSLLFLNASRICLVRRSEQETVMPGMWELPQTVVDGCGMRPILTLSHAIMNTDYTVRVFRVNGDGGRGVDRMNPADGKWVQASAVRRLPLTGLARKILSRVGYI